MKVSVSIKHLEIKKIRSNLMAIVIAAVVVSVFCLVSARQLASQISFQGRVLGSKHQAVKQLQANLAASKTLIDQYNNVFEGNDPMNMIGGRNTTDPNSAPPDGDNARIVLDSLPQSYDFPALLTSVYNIMASDGIASPNISGTDQSATTSSAPSTNPQPVEIDFSVSGSSSYANVQKLVKDFERSIRPFNITNMQVSGSDASMQFSFNMATYFQTAMTFQNGSKEVH